MLVRHIVDAECPCEKVGSGPNQAGINMDCYMGVSYALHISGVSA